MIVVAVRWNGDSVDRSYFVQEMEVSPQAIGIVIA